MLAAERSAYNFASTVEVEGPFKSMVFHSPPAHFH